MANRVHLERLLSGADEWNAWRAAAPETPDLSGADLTERGLDGVNLSGADLRGTALTGSSLRNADLRSASAQDARLDHAMLFGANLSGAALDGAVLAHAHLQEATIYGGSAIRADLRGVQGYRLTAGSADSISGRPVLPTDMTGANLNRAWLPNARLQNVVLDGVEARDAVFEEASLSGIRARRADLRRATFNRAWLTDADVSGALLVRAQLREVRGRGTDFSGCDLTDATLEDADLRSVRAHNATFAGANLCGADLRDTDIGGADLSGADLTLAVLVRANLDGADLSRSRVYGTSAWGVSLADAVQDRLVITLAGEPVITVNDLQVAQFVYLMLDNDKLRNIIDTVTSKTVLILGRFTAERKAVLDAIRDHLRSLDLVSVIFDFDRPAQRNYTETITLLARMARYVIADLTDPNSVPWELGSIVDEAGVPLLPLIAEGHRPYSMFVDLLDNRDVLDLRTYADVPTLLKNLTADWIPALECRRSEIAARRAAAAARLQEVQTT